LPKGKRAFSDGAANAQTIAAHGQAAGPEARLSIPACGGRFPFSLGTPAFPWKCPIAFLRKKLYNINKTTKRQAGRVLPTPVRPYAGEYPSPTQQI